MKIEVTELIYIRRQLQNYYDRSNFLKKKHTNVTTKLVILFFCAEG